MAWIESVKDGIVANNLGVFGTNLFIGGMDDGDGVPEPTIGLAEYTGQVMETGAPGVAVEMPQLQVAVRAQSYVTARDRINAIRDLLVLVENQNFHGTQFLRIAPQNTINYLQRDRVGRHMFSANFSVWL